MSFWSLRSEFKHPAPIPAFQIFPPERDEGEEERGGGGQEEDFHDNLRLHIPFEEDAAELESINDNIPFKWLHNISHTEGSCKAKPKAKILYSCTLYWQ